MFANVISPLVVNAVKSSVKSLIRIDELINKLKENCPSQSELQRIIDQKNQLTNALILVQTNLTTLTTITQTVNSIITPVDVVINVIKNIPIPTAVAGVGIPVNLIVRLSDILELLKDLVKLGKVSVKAAQQAFKIISDNITKVINKLNQLDNIILICAAQTGFTGSISNQTAELTSNSLVNTVANEELENSLSPNSPNPRFYKEWRLILETDPNNKFSFPRRRVIAQKSNPEGRGLITLISDFGPPGSNGYSYSSDTQILVKDIEFKIDNPNWKSKSVLTEIGEIQAEAEAAAAEATRQAEEAKRGKVIFFGQTGNFENIPIGNFDGYDAGFYPVTNDVEGMIGDARREISSVRVGRGMKITIFYNDYFLTKPGISENDSNLQNLSKRVFEHSLDAQTDYLEEYVGDEFNDHVDSFIIDKLIGGTITENPPERLAIYEPTYALKRRSKKILVDNSNNILQSADRYNGYVPFTDAPWGQPTNNINNNTLIFRSPSGSNPVERIISLYSQLGQYNFILNNNQIDTVSYNNQNYYNTSNFYSIGSGYQRYNTNREFYIEKIS